MSDRLRLLFVCSRNQWRSPTAERIYSQDARVQVRSAGTTASARRRVSTSDVEWADIVLVMERTHQRRLQQSFSKLLEVQVEILDIPDQYKFMDPQLVEEIRSAVEPVISSLVDE